MKRIEWIDGLKAWSVFLVVLGHVIWVYKGDSAVYQFIYLYHMPLFFMISGITFYISTNKSGEDKRISFRYIWHRLINLSVPMIFFVVIDICLKPGEDIFFYYNGIWFLLHLCMILAVYYIMAKLKMKQMGTILILAGWMVMGLLQIYLLQCDRLILAKFACEISKWCGYYIVFEFGIYVYTHLEILERPGVELVFGSLFIAAVVSAFIFGMQDNIALFRVIAGLPGGGIHVLLFSKRKKIYSFEKMVAVASLEIYLIHVNVFQKILLPLTPYGEQEGILKILLTVLLLIFYLVVPIGVYLLEKRWIPLKMVFHSVAAWKGKNGD